MISVNLLAKKYQNKPFCRDMSIACPDMSIEGMAIEIDSEYEAVKSEQHIRSGGIHNGYHDN
jgi:hypothetical protein